MELSGRVAYLDESGAVTQVRDLGPDPVVVKPGLVVPIEDRKLDGPCTEPPLSEFVVSKGKAICQWIPLETEPRLIPKRVIVDRLHAAGILEKAFEALNAADLYTRERWNTRTDIYADDPTAVALLKAIGANPAEILA